LDIFNIFEYSICAYIYFKCVLVVDKKLDPQLFSLVVVEGGPKAIKFYKNLMLKRIKWDTFIKKVIHIYYFN
jgi:hypothetical protein